MLYTVYFFWDIRSIIEVIDASVSPHIKSLLTQLYHQSYGFLDATPTTLTRHLINPNLAFPINNYNQNQNQNHTPPSVPHAYGQPQTP